MDRYRLHALGDTGIRWVAFRQRLGAVLLSVAPVVVLAASVETSVVVKAREVETGFPVEATVEAVKQATIAAQVSGKVLEIRAEAGQRVKAGETLVRLDAREAAGSDASAQANLAQARLAYERARKLQEQKFISQSAVDQAEAALKAAQGAAGAAGAGVSHSVVTSPISGVVAQRHVEPGEMASPGRPLVTVFEPRGLRVIAAVPQNRLSELRASIARGGKARIELPESGKWLNVSRIELLPVLDARSRSATVRLYPEEAGEGSVDLAPGMFARVHFVLGAARKLTVPSEAIVRRGEVIAVYVLDANGAARLRQVRLGETVPGGGIEVLSGLADGERVSLLPVRTGIEMKPASSEGSKTVPPAAPATSVPQR